jgi:hypothetical protein
MFRLPMARSGAVVTAAVATRSINAGECTAGERPQKRGGKDTRSGKDNLEDKTNPTKGDVNQKGQQDQTRTQPMP